MAENIAEFMVNLAKKIEENTKEEAISVGDVIGSEDSAFFTISIAGMKIKITAIKQRNDKYSVVIEEETKAENKIFTNDVSSSLIGAFSGAILNTFQINGSFYFFMPSLADIKRLYYFTIALELIATALNIEVKNETYSDFIS